MRWPAVVLAAGLWLTAATSGSAGTIAYLYADASEGAAGGGHAALVVDDRVFHFEHRAPGVLGFAREAFADVERRYGVRDNRTIVLYKISVSEETRTLILDEFTRRYLVQEQHQADQRALGDDRRLLELALARRLGARGEALSLEGAGLFFEEAMVPEALWGSPNPAVESGSEEQRARRVSPLPAPPVESGPENQTVPRTPALRAPALVTLRDLVSVTRGEDFLARSIARARGELDRLAPDSLPDPLPTLWADRLAAGSPGLARRYREHVLALLSLQALAEARPLVAGSTTDGGPRGLDLEDEDIPLVERLIERLQSSLVRLLDSRRPDWGYPMLVGMARLIALDETVRTGRWIALDPGAAGTPGIPRERLLRDPALAERFADRARGEVESARRRLRSAGVTSEGVPEAELARFESALSRLAAIAEVERGGRDPRAPAGARALAHGAPHSNPSLRGLDTEDIRRALAVARAREAAHAAAFQRVYAYDLFTRNCVTEIFRTIEAALARPILAGEPGLEGTALAERVRAAEIERLGGYVDPEEAWQFIPAMAAASVRERFAVSEIVEIPSYRRSALQRMYREERPLHVFLRESNTLSSTLYRKQPGDSAFLFFTDDEIATRPLFGAANLLTGLGVAAAGLVMLPVDHGGMLRAGLAGALWSLPELAFFNIRKGSFAHAERAAPGE